MELHGKIIELNFADLVENIQSISKVWDQLIQMGVISLGDVNQIKERNPDQRSQVRLLLDYIRKRRNVDYKRLREALQKTNQSRVVDEFLPASILHIRVSLTADPAVEDDKSSLYSEIEQLAERNKEDFINVLLLPTQVLSDATNLIFILKCFTEEHIELLKRLYESFCSGSLQETLQTLVRNESIMEKYGISKLYAEVEIESAEYREAVQYLSICKMLHPENSSPHSGLHADTETPMMQKSKNLYQLVATEKADYPKGGDMPVTGLAKRFEARQLQKALRQQYNANTSNHDDRLRFEEDDLFLNIASKGLLCTDVAQQDYNGSIFVLPVIQIASAHGGWSCWSCPVPWTRRRATACKIAETEDSKNNSQRIVAKQNKKKEKGNAEIASSENKHQKKIEGDTKETTAVTEADIEVTTEVEPMLASKPVDTKNNEDQQGPQEIRAEEDVRFSRYQTSCDLVICSTAQRTDDESTNWPVLDRSSIERLDSETPCQDVEKIFMNRVNISKCHVEVFKMLSKCDGTSDLFLTDVLDGSDDSYNICNGLKKCMKKYKKLRNFGIWYIHLHSSGSKFIEHIDTSNLVTFTLQETLLCKPGETLSKMLSTSTTLRWLNLLETKLEDNEWVQIFKAIKSHCPDLIGLVLDYNDLSNVTDKVLETLKAVKRLRVLGISYCGMNEELLEKLTQNLPGTLEVLDMRDSNTNIRDRAFEYAIRVHPSIRFLRVEERQVSEEALNRINQLLNVFGGKAIIYGTTPEDSYTFLYNDIYATACKA